jgi:xylulokinase
MADPLLLGVDVGTTSVKAAAYDLAGRERGRGVVGYRTRRPRPGWVEQDAETWWAATAEAISQVGAVAPLREVAAVGVCSQVNTHVLVDERGRPLHPAITWQDQRCAAVASALDATLSDARRDELWGGPFRVDPSFALSRVAWLRDEAPEVLAAGRWLLQPKDLVNLRLTGEVGADPISAVGLVGRDGAYGDGILELVPEAAGLLAPLREPAEVLGTVLATETGLPATARVVTCTMDAWGNLHGSGLRRVGEGMEVAGTSEILAVLSDRGPGAAGVISFQPVEGLRLHAGPTQAGGDALRWFAAARDAQLEEVLGSAAQAPPGSGGLLFLPHLAGERAPLWDSEVRAGFLGLGAEHQGEHLARAVLEGVALSARHALEAVDTAAGLVAHDLVTSGGGARSELWCQVKADVLGRRLHRARVLDTAVLGAAMLAAVGTGLMADLDAATSRMVHVDRIFAPEPEHAEVYAALYDVYRQVHPALADVHRRLAVLRGAGAGAT